MAVAVLGLGQMGRGIARNLDAAGLLAAACDVQDYAFAAAGLSGRVHNLGGQALVDMAAMILCVVPSCHDIETALAGCTGRGQLVIDMTTSDPEQSRILAETLSARGFRYMDAAMTGGAAGADAGTLTLMVGGTEADVREADPVLRSVAGRIFHLGPMGAGHTVKLVHNMILHSSFMATCEGVSLAVRAGLDPKAVVEVLNAGNARSFVTETRFPRDILSGTMMARSTVGNLQKDLGLASHMAAGLDAPAPYARLTHQLLTEAMTDLAQTDFSWLFPKYDDIARHREQHDDL